MCVLRGNNNKKMSEKVAFSARLWLCVVVIVIGFGFGGGVDVRDVEKCADGANCEGERWIVMISVVKRKSKKFLGD